MAEESLSATSGVPHTLLVHIIISTLYINIVLRRSRGASGPVRVGTNRPSGIPLIYYASQTRRRNMLSC